MFYLRVLKTAEDTNFWRNTAIHTGAGAVPVIGPYIAGHFTPPWRDQGTNILPSNLIGAGLGFIGGGLVGSSMGANPMTSALVGTGLGGALGSFLASQRYRNRPNPLLTHVIDPTLDNARLTAAAAAFNMFT